MVFWHLKIIQFRSWCSADTSKEIDNSLSSCCFHSSPHGLFSLQAPEHRAGPTLSPLPGQAVCPRCLSPADFGITQSETTNGLWSSTASISETGTQGEGILTGSPLTCVCIAIWFNISLAHSDIAWYSLGKKNPISKHAGDWAQAVAALVHPHTTAVKRGIVRHLPRLHYSPVLKKGFVYLGWEERISQDSCYSPWCITGPWNSKKTADKAKLHLPLILGSFRSK